VQNNVVAEKIEDGRMYEGFAADPHIGSAFYQDVPIIARYRLERVFGRSVRNGFKQNTHITPPPLLTHTHTHTHTLTSFNSGASGFQWHFSTFQFQWLTRGAIAARASAHTA
jgi:hypothetical protein